MTVKQLIEELQQCNPDYTVVMPNETHVIRVLYPVIAATKQIELPVVYLVDY